MGLKYFSCKSGWFHGRPETCLEATAWFSAQKNKILVLARSFEFVSQDSPTGRWWRDWCKKDQHHWWRRQIMQQPLDGGISRVHERYATSIFIYWLWGLNSESAYLFIRLRVKLCLHCSRKIAGFQLFILHFFFYWVGLATFFQIDAN